MRKLYPSARPTAGGFKAQIAVRADKGRMVGSRVAKRIFATAEEALAFAIDRAHAAVRCAPDVLIVA